MTKKANAAIIPNVDGCFCKRLVILYIMHGWKPFCFAGRHYVPRELRGACEDIGASCRNTCNHIAFAIYCVAVWAMAHYVVLLCRSVLFLQEAHSIAK